MTALDTVLAAYEPLLDPHAKIDELTTELPYFDAEIIEELILQSINILASQKSVIYVNSPCTIVGDIHGNIFDLLRILQKFPGFRTTDSILFLGDYVDRGTHSVEVVTLLLALLCKYPDQVFLLRGNHEFSQVNLLYGFYEEVFMTYQGTDVWESFHKAFAWLPFAAVVGDKIFCVHGGLSPKVTSLAQIADIKRPVYAYENGSIVSDLVWSDPHDNVPMYSQSNRGMGVLFGSQATRTFLKTVGLKLLVRAHQCFVNGYSTFAENAGVSVFSSSEYCKLAHNKCGVMRFEDGERVDIYVLDVATFQSAKPTISMVFGKGLGLRKEASKVLMPKPLKRNVSTAGMVKKPKPSSARGRLQFNMGRGRPFRLGLDAFAY